MPSSILTGLFKSLTLLVFSRELFFLFLPSLSAVCNGKGSTVSWQLPYLVLFHGSYVLLSFFRDLWLLSALFIRLYSDWDGGISDIMPNRILVARLLKRQASVKLERLPSFDQSGFLSGSLILPMERLPRTAILEVSLPGQLQTNEYRECPLPWIRRPYQSESSSLTSKHFYRLHSSLSVPLGDTWEFRFLRWVLTWRLCTSASPVSPVAMGTFMAGINPRLTLL